MSARHISAIPKTPVCKIPVKGIPEGLSLKRELGCGIPQITSSREFPEVSNLLRRCSRESSGRLESTNILRESYREFPAGKNVASFPSPAFSTTVPAGALPWRSNKTTTKQEQHINITNNKHI